MSDKQAYITLMGRSGWAVVNSFYSSILETEFRPCSVTILYESEHANTLAPVVEGLKIIQETYTKPNVTAHSVSTSDMDAAGEAARPIVNRIKEQEGQVALDITGGRKALVAGTLLGSLDSKLDYVYYLDIETTEGVAKPYPMIPYRMQQLKELKRKVDHTERIELKPETGWKEADLDKEFLTIALNHAYRRNTRLTVNVPFLDVDILELNLAQREVRVLTDRTQYDNKLREHSVSGWDFPNYNQLRRSFCYSGILDYKNKEALWDGVLEEYRRHRDPGLGVSKWYLSLDTNLFRSGFVSCLEAFEESQKIDRGEVLYLTSDVVVQEVGNMTGRKYTFDHIRDAKRYYGPSKERLLDQFHNRGMLRTRTGEMAAYQLYKFMSWSTHERTAPVDLSSDREKRDKLLVKTVDEFASKRNARVFLVSADRDLSSPCKLARNLRCFNLEQHHEIPQTLEVTDQGIIDLLVALSVLYGVVKVNNLGYLFGEYGGKGTEDYMSRVKVFFENLERARIVEERIETCRKLLELGLVK
jgi:hypothetical protein